MKKISAVAVCALFMVISLLFSSCSVFGVTKVSIATTSATTTLPTTEPEQRYKAVDYEFTVQYTSNWIRFVDAASGRKAKIQMYMPDEWTADNTVFMHDKDKVAEIHPLILLKANQSILDNYAYNYTGEMPEIVSKKTVTLEKYSAKLIVQDGGKNDKGEYYIYTYYVQSGEVVAAVSFYSYDRNADTVVFEHCMDSIQVTLGPLPTTTAPTTVASETIKITV